MKVGTDGILLGAWVQLPPVLQTRPVRVLDIGSGTGLLALMLAQRLTDRLAGQFSITALEPEAAAAAQARDNMLNSPWAEQIQLQALSLQAYEDISNLPPDDLWISNPPFFDGAQRQSPRTERAMARHADADFIETLFRLAHQRLQPQGSLAVILPLDREGDYQAQARAWGWSIAQRCEVRHSPHHAVKRVLLRWQRQGALEAEPESEILSLKQKTPQGWQDSPAYAEWVRPFYLRYAQRALN